MAKRPCLDCGTLATSARCPPCTRSKDRARGTRQQRGLNAEYDRNRAIILAAATTCAVCGQPGTADDPLTAGHIDARIDGGGNALANLRPEHASYNYGGKRCRGRGRDPGGRGSDGIMAPP